MAEGSLKIVVVGPKEAGKTALANWITGINGLQTEYTPTVGVRILQVNREVPTDSGGRANVQIELWDCAGDSKFESVWPALQKGTDAAVLVYNPNDPDHTADKTGQVFKWFQRFIIPMGMKESQCLIFAHQNPRNQAPGPARSLSKALNNVTQANTTLDSDFGKNTVVNEFDAFVARVYANQQKVYQESAPQ
eukprot:Rmarinus@m.5834